MRVLPAGGSALLVEVADLSAVLALATAAAALPGVTDVVPAARTVLLHTAPRADLAALRREVLALRTAGSDVIDGAEVEIPVVYDGEDLAEVAAHTGLDPDEVVRAHTRTPWRVGFGGFAPGFAYLVGGDPRLRVPRRAQPRTRVPAGAVGLAGEFSGVYPRPSPGGWQLIGRTDAVLWDADRDPPALLTPGTRVRFTPRDPATGDPVVARDAADPATDDPVAAGGGAESATRRPVAERALQVLAVGPLALVQDLGRPGHAAVGVGRSGAADRAALRLANRLVGNPEGAAALEVLLGGLAVRARGPLTLALAGAAAPAEIDGRPVGHHAVLRLRAGQTLRLSPPLAGLRTYLAVAGGIALPAVLGSRSTDTMSGLGPAPVTKDDVLPVGPEPGTWAPIDVAPVAPPGGGPVVLRATPGPRADRLADLRALTRTPWTASSRSDRVGLRLDGEPLRHAVTDELPSEGMVRGAVQVPPGGTPVVFLADHPVTGGYPVVAVVVDADVDRAAQVRPGQAVRFRII